MQHTKFGNPQFFTNRSGSWMVWIWVLSEPKKTDTFWYRPFSSRARDGDRSRWALTSPVKSRFSRKGEHTVVKVSSTFFQIWFGKKFMILRDGGFPANAINALNTLKINICICYINKWRAPIPKWMLPTMNYLLLIKPASPVDQTGEAFLLVNS